MLATVDDEVWNDPYVVEELVNVWSRVNVLAVYVFGIVVDPWMKELIESFVPTHTPPIAKHPVVML